MVNGFDYGGMRPQSFESYYEQTRRLDALGISIPPEARVLEIQAPFAKMAVDVLTEVLIPTGFIIGDDEREDVLDLLRSTWQKNDMDSQFNLAASEAIAAGSAFWIVGRIKGEDHASIRAVDNRHAAVRMDAFGSTLEGVCVYRTDEGKAATYYTPERTEFYKQLGGRWVSDGHEPAPHGISIVPMFNKARLGDRYGRSDLQELRKVIDAASRTLTNLQVAQEVSAMPLRFLIGDGAAQMLANQQSRGAKDGQFGRGGAMQAYAGSLLALPSGGDAKQLSGMSLDTFVSVYRTYALQISAMTGIPPSMMGVASDNNPTSAEALRVAKDRLLARAEWKQRQFSDALEKVARLVVAMDGQSTDGLEALEVIWADAAAPSTSAQMATAMQAQSQDIISSETAREFMRLSPEQLRREAERDEERQEMGGLTVDKYMNPEEGRLGEDPDEDSEEGPEEGRTQSQEEPVPQKKAKKAVTR